MPERKPINLVLLLIPALLLAVLAACQNKQTDTISVETATLIPFHSETPTPILATATPQPPTSAPLPSPTPTYRVHEVKKNEDLGGIAYLYQVSLAALMGVNPDVNPNAMSVGTKLNIPAAEVNAEGEDLLPTPLGVQAGQAQCYASAAQGSWCFSEVDNPLDTAVENVSAVLRIQNAADQDQQSFSMFPGLNTLPAGESLPLMVYLPFEVNPSYAALVEIQSALPLQAENQRYLPVHLENAQVHINSRVTANLSGEVWLDAAEGQTARKIWLLATAYNQQEHIVGVRRLELDVQLTAGGKAEYAFEVYAAGGSIARVAVRAEAMP